MEAWRRRRAPGRDRSGQPGVRPARRLTGCRAPHRVHASAPGCGQESDTENSASEDNRLLMAHKKILRKRNHRPYTTQLFYIQTCVFLWQKPMTDPEGDRKCVRSMTGLSSHCPSPQIMHKTEIPERRRSMLPRNVEVNAEEKAKSSVVFFGGRDGKVGSLTFTATTIHVSQSFLKCKK